MFYIFVNVAILGHVGLKEVAIVSVTFSMYDKKQSSGVLQPALLHGWPGKITTTQLAPILVVR